jgi:tetratricopeptide (TPR) repeat protein
MRLRTRLAAASVIGWILLGAIGLGPLAPLGPADAVAAAATTPCHDADALLAAGRYTDAYAAYAAVRPGGATCARQGRAAAADLQAAGQLISVGLTTQADAEIVQAVDADPTLTLPASLLPPRAAAAQRAIALAKALAAHGFRQQAAQILQSLIDADPGIRLAPAVTAVLAPPATAALARPGESFWASLGNSVPSWAGITTAVALLLFLGVFLIPRLRNRLYLQKFTVTEGVSDVDPEDLRVGVRDDLRRLADRYAATPRGRRLRLDIAGPYDETLDIGSVEDKAPDKLQFVFALLRMLLRRFPRLSRARLITGDLQADVVVEMGMQTVDKVPICSAPVRHKKFSFPPASPASAQYAQLSLPIAAWIIFERYPRYTLGGTHDLDSFAVFAAGCAWQDVGDLARAEQFYHDARTKDRNNTAAAHNLATLWQQDEIVGSTTLAGSGVKGGDWRALLRTVIGTTGTKTHDPQWVRSRYALSRGLADLAQDREEAKHYARELAVEIEEQLRTPGKDTPVDLLTSSRGPVLALATSEMIPLTADVNGVSVMGVIPAGITEVDVIQLLRYGGDGAPEKLAAFVEANYPDDAEVKYNLYRYQRNRNWACEDAIKEINRELGSASGERRTELQARLQEVEAAAVQAGDTMSQYRREISETADASVLARVDAVARAEHPREQPGGADARKGLLDVIGQATRRREVDMRKHRPRIRTDDSPWNGSPAEDPDGGPLYGDE